MSTYVYAIPVHAAEADFLFDQLSRDVFIAQPHWFTEEDPMTGEVTLMIQTPRPLSLVERRKIVSCGLDLHLVEVQ